MDKSVVGKGLKRKRLEEKDHSGAQLHGKVTNLKKKLKERSLAGGKSKHSDVHKREHGALMQREKTPRAVKNKGPKSASLRTPKASAVQNRPSSVSSVRSRASTMRAQFASRVRNRY